ncbi:MAG: DUF4325 domain-containing protein [Gallionellaceae bacterium]|nr:MAG: DUF4325 domain-containing protein [Gallionellaceae bacterium]
MFTYPIKIADTDLASRQAAAELRAEIERSVSAGKKVSIDLGAVLSVSESYADELFGVLALRHGLEWLSEHVGLHNLNPFVFRAIASAIRQRLRSQSPQAPDIALLAARKALKQRQSRST